MPTHGFPKSARLTRRDEFDAAFAAQLVAKDGAFVCHGRPNGLGRSRLGIVVGKRVRTAPARNRIKRLLREAFRLNREKLAEGWDYLFIPRKIAGLTLAETAESVLRLAWKVVHLENAAPEPPKV